MDGTSETERGKAQENGVLEKEEPVHLSCVTLKYVLTIPMDGKQASAVRTGPGPSRRT